MSHTLSLSVQNASVRLRIVMLEPWGREFLLGADEKLEITARAHSAGAGLRLVESLNRTLIFVEACSTIRVIQGGVTHNLDLEAIVGATAPQVAPAQSREDPMWDRHLDG
jgi:hypothetical protein